MENMRTDLWVSRITREEHQGDRFDTQGMSSSYYSWVCFV